MNEWLVIIFFIIVFSLMIGGREAERGFIDWKQIAKSVTEEMNYNHDCPDCGWDIRYCSCQDVK